MHAEHVCADQAATQRRGRRKPTLAFGRIRALTRGIYNNVIKIVRYAGRTKLQLKGEVGASQLVHSVAYGLLRVTSITTQYKIVGGRLATSRPISSISLLLFRVWRHALAPNQRLGGGGGGGGGGGRHTPNSATRGGGVGRRRNKAPRRWGKDARLHPIRYRSSSTGKRLSR